MQSLTRSFLHLSEELFDPRRMACGNMAEINARLERETFEIKRQYYAAYYDKKINELRHYFQDQGYHIALACFNFLLEKKAGKWRKNDYAPSHSHEIDQIIPLLTSLTDGILKDKIAEIEAVHGSIERWFIDKIVHDLGEEHFLFAEDLEHVICEHLDELGIDINDERKKLIQYAGQDMECITDCRKFPFEKVESITGEPLNLSFMKPGDIVPLDHLKDFFWEKMDVLDHGRDNLQIFAFWDPEKSAPKVTVTRYGWDTEDTPREHTTYAVCLNLYSQCVMRHHIYLADTKVGDRISNNSTRIEIDENIDDYGTYLDTSTLIFEDMGGIQRLVTEIYPDSPLKECLLSQGDMMGSLRTNGHIYVRHHTQKNTPGHKGCNPSNFNNLSDITDRSPIWYSRFPNAFLYYEHTPFESHPIAIQMRELRQAPDASLNEGHKHLYRQIKFGLIGEYGQPAARVLKKPKDTPTLEDLALSSDPYPQLPLAELKRD